MDSFSLKDHKTFKLPGSDWDSFRPSESGFVVTPLVIIIFKGPGLGFYTVRMCLALFGWSESGFYPFRLPVSGMKRFTLQVLPGLGLNLSRLSEPCSNLFCF